MNILAVANMTYRPWRTEIEKKTIIEIVYEFVWRLFRFCLFGFWDFCTKYLVYRVLNIWLESMQQSVRYLSELIHARENRTTGKTGRNAAPTLARSDFRSWQLYLIVASANKKYKQNCRIKSPSDGHCWDGSRACIQYLGYVISISIEIMNVQFWYSCRAHVYAKHHNLGFGNGIPLQDGLLAVVVRCFRVNFGQFYDSNVWACFRCKPRNSIQNILPEMPTINLIMV